MRAPEIAARLRQILIRSGPANRHFSVALGHSAADATLGGGLRLSALHEVYATATGDSAAAVGFAAGLAARAILQTGAGAHAKAGWLFWIRQDFSALEHGELHALGLLDLGLDPARTLLLKAADVADALKAAGNALACRGIGALVIEAIGETKLFDLTASRRLALAAAGKGVTVIVLRLNAGLEPSAAETRWLVRASASPPQDDWGAPVFDVDLARNRHGACGHWVMEWCCDDRTFREPNIDRAARPGAVVTAAFDRPHRTSPEWLRRAR